MPALSFALIAPLLLQAATLTEIRQAETVRFPAYESYKGIERYAPTRADYLAAINDHRFIMEKIAYRSDGLEVFAYLYRPAHPPKGRKLPVVIFNRGSYVRDDFSPEVLMPAHRLAQAGYLVIAPMLRGSGGAQGRDEMGGADVDDLLNIVNPLRALGYADLDHLYLYGESRGAIMSMIALREHFPARAVAVYGLTSDFATQVGVGAPARGMAGKVWPDFATRETEIIESRSAVRWADRVNSPVLIIHGGRDTSVAPQNALDMAAALARAGKPYELRIFYDEGHVLSGRAAERDAAVVAWFRRFD